MYEDVLLPVDEATKDTAVVYHVAEIANATGADVTLLYVADTAHDSVTVVRGEVVDALEEKGEDVLAETADVLASLGVDARTEVVQGDPARVVVDYADEYDFDLVAMPTRGREGLSRALLGSVTEKVVRLSAVPVLTAQVGDGDESADLEFPYEDVLVAVDGSDAARRAAEHAFDLAAATDATVHVLSVVDSGLLGVDVRTATVEDSLEANARTVVDDIADLAADRDVEVVAHVERGRPADGIRDAAAAVGADAIFLGTTGRRGVDRILLGSVAEETVRSSPVPVVTVRDPVDA